MIVFLYKNPLECDDAHNIDFWNYEDIYNPFYSGHIVECSKTIQKINIPELYEYIIATDLGYNKIEKRIIMTKLESALNSFPYSFFKEYSFIRIIDKFDDIKIEAIFQIPLKNRTICIDFKTGI